MLFIGLWFYYGFIFAILTCWSYLRFLVGNILVVILVSSVILNDSIVGILSFRQRLAQISVWLRSWSDCC